MIAMRYKANDSDLSSSDFIELAQKVWPWDYDSEKVQEALTKTMNVTAWDGNTLIGCVRVLTDGYFFGTVPEIFVHPAYRRQGIGKRLMEIAWDESPTSLFFGAQPGNEGFFERLGYERSMVSFCRRKPRT